MIFPCNEREKIHSVHSEGGLDGLRQDIGLAMEYLSLLSWSWGRAHFAIVLTYFRLISVRDLWVNGSKNTVNLK